MKERLKYKITLIDETKLKFQVLKLDTENLKNACVLYGNWWIVCPGISSNGASFFPQIEMISLEVGPTKNITTFACSQTRSAYVEFLKELLNKWKHDAF
jgi:hypothetical protein